MKIPCALTIAGSDSGSGAGIQADLKTFSALGVHGLVVITSVTAQNTRGVQGVFDLPPKFVQRQLDSVAQDFEVGWVKTGMLSRSEIIREVRGGVKENGLYLVVDPVMVAASGDPLLQEDAIQELKSLLKHAELVAPNILEAEKLSELKITSLEDCKKAAEKISKLGPAAVLVKGGHLESEEIHNILYTDGEFIEFRLPRVESGEIHGTGCTFSAAITAELAKGRTLKEAVKRAGEFVSDAVKGRLRLGGGAEVVNPLAREWKITSGSEEIIEVQEAAHLLNNTPEFAALIPEVGTNIAMAPKNAEKTGDVVGLSGRITKISGEPHLTGIAVPGGSEHVANIILTAMKHIPQIRAGMNIRYSPEIVEEFRESGLDVVGFDREREPEGVKTMEWGTEQAIEKAGGVPDVIFDKGGIGKEAMIRVLGKTPSEVIEKVLEIVKRLKSLEDKAREEN